MARVSSRSYSEGVTDPVCRVAPSPPKRFSPRRDTSCQISRARLTISSGTYMVRINQLTAIAVSAGTFPEAHDQRVGEVRKGIDHEQPDHDDRGPGAYPRRRRLPSAG